MKKFWMKYRADLAILVVLVMIFVLGFLTGCKKADVDGVMIRDFSASNYNVAVYQSVTLTWRVENSTLVILSGAGVVPGVGSIQVKQNESTKYMLSAIGPGDSKDDAALTINVDKTTPCSGLVITGVTGTSQGVEVRIGTNTNQFYSAKNVVVQVKLIDGFGGVMETGTATIPEIRPGQGATTFIALSRSGYQAKTECAIIGCSCDFTEPSK